ncbi:MAG: hypothetical protein ACREBB_11375 [Nitrosotalea sp.]
MNADQQHKIGPDHAVLDSHSEKMIQHVVVENKPPGIVDDSTTMDDICNIPRDTDDFQKIDIKLNLPCFLMRNLVNNIQKRFGDNGPTLNGYFEGKIMEWNKELELQQHVVSLSFKGSFPRIDVLERLYRVAAELEEWPEFPKFKRNHLEVIVRKTIGPRDPRTFRDYFECLIRFIEAKNGGRISFYGDYDVSGFRKVIEEALTRTEKGEIEKTDFLSHRSTFGSTST